MLFLRLTIFPLSVCYRLEFSIFSYIECPASDTPPPYPRTSVILELGLFSLLPSFDILSIIYNRINIIFLASWNFRNTIGI